MLPLIRSPRTYSRHGTAARAMRSDQIRSATRGGETVDQVPSGDPIPLWGVPWSNARCAIDSLPRHASQGIVSPRSYSPSHAHDALHVWALRICTAGQQAWWVIWGCGGGAPNNKGLAHRTTSVGVAGAKIETHGVYSPGRVCEPGVAVALTLDTPAPNPCKTTSCSTICCTTFCVG